MTMLPALTLAPLHPVPFPPEEATNLICFPPAGGGFASFLPLIRPQGGQSQQDVRGLVCWGVQIAWTADWSYAPLVTALTDALLAQVSAPFLFWGESLGALLAYGVANELRTRQAVEPCGLVVVAMAAPHLYHPPQTAHWSEEDWHVEIRRLGGPAAAALADSVRLAHRIRSMEAAACIACSYQVHAALPLEVPIAVFGGEQDQVFPPDLLAGWKAHTRQNCSVVFYQEAGHAELLEESALRAQLWKDGLARIRSWREVPE